MLVFPFASPHHLCITCSKPLCAFFNTMGSVLSLTHRAVCFLKHAKLSGSEAPLLCSCWQPALLSMLALSDPASKALLSCPFPSLPSWQLLRFIACLPWCCFCCCCCCFLLLLLFKLLKLSWSSLLAPFLTSLYEWDKETRVPWDHHHQSVYTRHGIILFCPSKAHRCHPLQDLLFFVYCYGTVMNTFWILSTASVS